MPIPATLGWYQVPNSLMRPFMPGTSYNGYALNNPNFIIDAWNSGVLDTLRNRFIIWGGGHADYWGNELYAFDLNTLTWARITNPGTPTTSGGIVGVNDGSYDGIVPIDPGGTQANARHTYGGLAYMANVDKMFVWGGALSYRGDPGSVTWAFNFATNTWERKSPTGQLPGHPYSNGSTCSYDPNTGNVFLHDLKNFYSYNPLTNVWTKLVDETFTPGFIDYHVASVIDPVRKKFLLFGGPGQAWSYDIAPGSSYIRTALSLSGGSAIQNRDGPGVAYDPQGARIIGWGGGGTVYSLDLNTNVWTPIVNSGGPGAAPNQGIYGHWQYSPASNVFIGITSIDASLYTLRLGAAPVQYFVDFTAGLDTNSGTSSASPWKTIAKVNATNFLPGETVNFKRGSIWTGTTLVIDSSGVSGNPVTYQAYGSGNRPEIVAPSASFAHSIEVPGDWNVIKDLLVRGGHEAGIRIDASGTNNVVNDIEATATGIGVMVMSSNNLITRCYVHDLTMIVNDATPNNDYGAVGFWSYAPNNEFSYNLGVNCKAASIDFGTDGGFLEIYNFGDNTLVHHNTAINCNGFIETGSTVGGNANNVQIYYNIINNSGGLCLNVGSFNISLSAWKFENNTLYIQNGNAAVVNRIFGCRADLSALSVKNNIFYSDTQIASNGTFTHTNNLYYMVNMVSGSGVGYSLGAGELSGDPKFVTPGTDFHLLSNSPAINAGANLGYTQDFAGTAVPSGSAPDMGAYEFVGVADSTPPNSVAITAPSAGATVSGAAVTVSGTALDNIGVVGVQFKLDGVNLNAEDLTSPYSTVWDTTATTNGAHALTCTARDAAGNTTTSPSISVTVNNAGPSATATFQLTSTLTGTFPFTIGHGFKKGDFIGTPILDLPANHQIIVKRTWNDGSVKHAIASGHVALTANVAKTVTVSAGTPPGGTNLTSANIQTANPQASVQCGSIGTVNLSSLLAAPFRTWISGPEMVECHYRSAVGADATLSVWFHVRLYKNGRIWVRAIVENGYLDVTTSHKLYVPTVTIGGTVVYTFSPAVATITGIALMTDGSQYWEIVTTSGHGFQAKGQHAWFTGIGGTTQLNDRYIRIAAIAGNTLQTDYHSSPYTAYTSGGTAEGLSHLAYTRWTAEGWIGGDPAITPKHNSQYLIDTKLVPNYWKKNPTAAVLNSALQVYTPCSNGDHEAGMSTAGYQDGIGVLPRWDALCVTTTDPRAYRYSLANSSSLNSYGIVWRDSSTQLVAKPSAWPNYAIQGGTYKVGAGGLVWAMTHHPSEGYLTYLLTGDYWHYETMLMQASLNYLARNNSAGGSGLTRILTSETRGTAWALRTNSQLAALFPTGDTVGAEYQTLLANNMLHWQTVKNGLTPPGIGSVYEYGFGFDPGLVSPWQQHFWIASIGLGRDIEPLASMTVFNDVTNYMYKWPVGITGDASGYCFTQASIYTAKISDSTSVDPTTWYTNWPQVYAATFPGVPCTNTLQGSSAGTPNNAAFGQWGQYLIAMAYAVDHGAPGAAAAWARLTGATNWSALEFCVGDSGNVTFHNVPQWGVIPRATATDIVAPTVNMTSPAAGATVTGTVTVSANASDAVGVVGVQFQLDGANLGVEDTTSPYSISWNTTTASNGTHLLTAVARDAAGNTATSTAVSVTVNNGDLIAPTVALSAPANGATVTGTVSVTANANDNVGVVGVQFTLNGGNLQAEDLSAPYAISWNTVGTVNGVHLLRAVARDAAGNTATSAAVSVTVSNPPSAPTNLRIL